MSYDTQVPPSPQAVMRNGLGTAALILGIIGTLAGLIPLLFWLAGILGLIALILGLVGKGRVKRREANNKGVALTGALLGLAALILSVVGAVITFTAVSDAVKEIDKAVKDAAPQDPSPQSSASGGKGGASAAPDAGKGGGLAAGDTSVYDDDLKVTVSDPKPYTPGEFAVGHTEGNKAYQFTVVIENGGKEKFDAVAVTLDARAGKDGVTAEQIYDGKVGEGFSGTILPGKKATVTYAFDAPATAKNLTVEVSPGFDYNAAQWELKVG
ncbi:DUF4352 domain-containing protein [Streptomyces sp. NPDC058855]|uniref:DUF4352 domain-containing protein n=1 Tax=Streptomyces sp. NPDC058855 TaxID=3346651 RepID=UPI00368BF73D